MITTKTDARAALGVRASVDDASVYGQLKLRPRFVRLAFLIASGYLLLILLPLEIGDQIRALLGLWNTKVHVVVRH